LPLARTNGRGVAAARAALRRIDRVFGLALAVAVGLLMIVTCIDVFGRQVLNEPLRAAFELIRIGLGIMVFIGLPVVSARNEHITIGLLNPLFGAGAQRVKRALLCLVLTVLAAFLAQRLWVQGDALARQNELFMFLRIRLAPIVYAMSVLTALTALIFLVRAWVSMHETRRDDELIGV
jgi:TRAP-type C4-dicarboxylate transport system permease small subunit